MTVKRMANHVSEISNSFIAEKAVLRIRDVYPGSEFSFPDPGSKRFRIPDPNPHQRIKVFLTPKLFLNSRKIYLGCYLFIPDPDFFSIPDLGSSGKKIT
jgi:hypothetical protein